MNWGQTINLLTTALAALLFCTPALAKPELVALTSLSDVDDYVHSTLKNVQVDQLAEVEVIHMGERTPQLESLLRWLNRSHIPIRFRQVSLDEFNASADKLTDAYSGLLSKVTYEEDGTAERFGIPRQKLVGSMQESWRKVRSFFGMSGPLSWVLYKVKRTPKQKTVEGGVGVFKTLVTSVVLYTSLHALQVGGQDVNFVLPILLSAACTFGFDYWQRGNLAFRTQGENFNYNTGRFEMNRKLYLLVSFIHSFIMRESIMALAHLPMHTATGIAFTMGLADFWRTFKTSAKGVVGKAPIEMGIKRRAVKHGEWWKIGWMTAFGSFFASLQILDQFSVGQHFRTALTIFGVVGLGYEAFLDRESLSESMRSVLRTLTLYVSGQSEMPEECATLLVPRVKEPQ